MHEWSFKTSKFTTKVSGWNFSKSTKTLDPISGKNKMKLKNLSPGNHENPFVSSLKAN